MKPLASRLRRLDDALADLPLEEPMLLTELDGYLTGIVISPEPVPQTEWLQGIWGMDEGGIAPFEDPLDVQWFVDAVMARYAEIVRDLTRGKPRPIFDIDERNGDVLWELWIDGFAEAMALRPDGWDALADGDDARTAVALERVSLLIDVARNESDLDSVEINALEDRAPTILVEIVIALYAPRSDTRIIPSGSANAADATTAKVGRNDPCLCGSGKKSKRCCG